METQRLDVLIARIAARQHGAFSLGQVLAFGGTTRMARSRCADGRWVLLDAGVYAHPAHPATWHRQAKAAELRFEEAAISGRSAAVLHDVVGLRPGAIEVTVPRGGGRSSRLATVRHRDDVATTVVDGIRVVSLEQAIADIAGTVGQGLLESAVEELILAGRSSSEALLEQHEKMVRCRTRGAGVLGSILEDRVTGQTPGQNEMERALYSLLDEPCFPDHVRQSPFPWWPEAPQRVDAYVPEWRRIVEADGRRWHARQADFERDKRRDHLAQSHGIEVTRLTYRQLVRDTTYARELLLQIGRYRRAA